MKVALTDRYTGEVFTLVASIEPRVGLSLRGHLYLCLETRPGREFTWEQWNDARGVLVASTAEEYRLFKRWQENGRDYESRPRRKKA